MGEVIKLSKIIRGKTRLWSKGFVTLKLTQDGEEVTCHLPIKSIGMAEFNEKLQDEMPLPPAKVEIVKKDSDLGTRLGYTEDTPTRLFDVTDADYIKAFSDYQNDYIWRTLVYVLDVEWEDENGNRIEDNETKIQVLKDTGISGHHHDAIMEAVKDLTKEREEKADFLSGKPSE